MTEIVACRRCAQEKPAHRDNPHLCDDCVKAENNRVSYYRQHNANWMEISKEADLQLWERQPAETDHEYHVWLAYRDAYPGKRPSYRDAAQTVNTSVDAVRKIASRWSFPARIQTWAKHVDEITLAQRHKEILEMNKSHIDLATSLREKLKTAIAKIDANSLTPREITALFKVTADVERKAHLNQPVVGNGLAVDDDNPDLKKASMKQENISEIVQILAKAGVLQNIGVRQTVTTEVVVKSDD